MAKQKPSADSLPILLSGATGFIGGHIQAVMRDAGVPVRALVRSGSANRSRLLAGTEAIVAELDDSSALARALEGTRAVVYAAGTVRGRDLDAFLGANVRGVEALVKALDTLTEPPPVLLISSLAASEPALSHYACSKAQGEQVLMAATALNWTILRPPAVYGPGDVEMRPLLAAIRRGLAPRPGPASQRIALIHGRDVALAVLAWLGETQACRHGLFAIDDGHGGYGWTELATLARSGRARIVPVPPWLLGLLGTINLALARVLRYAPMLTPGKARELQHERWLCDNSAFTRLTGWRPQVSLAEGVSALFDRDAAQTR
ncbi:MAG: NAD(P)-dependent oxidoreductase [Pseudomonadales bacterium]